MGTDQKKRKQTVEYSLEEFARFYSGTDRIALLCLEKLIERKQIIPYKIKNKEFSVEVEATPAFTLKLVFHHVLIEDGRHPSEIRMEKVCVEKGQDVQRLRFYNTLRVGATPKESSFVFDRISSHVKVWDYNFYTQAPQKNQTKLPWRLLREPMDALLEKAKILGSHSLNDCEKDIVPTMEFLDSVLNLYLDESTKVAYGRSKVSFDAQKMDAVKFSEEEKQAGISLLEQIGWVETKLKLQHFSENREDFFKSFVYTMTQKEGKSLYLWMRDKLELAASGYPKLMQDLPVYAQNQPIVKSCIDKILKGNGYTGRFPDYHKEKKAAFIEVSRVYERKYTYLNEKKKLDLVSFVESISPEGLEVTAVRSTILGKKKTDIYDTSMTAMDGCFCDQGRRRFEVEESVILSPDMEEEQVRERIEELALQMARENTKASKK